MPYELSGGQMQRVAIARALIHSPKLLLADEPIGNLDSKTSDVVLRLLKRAAAERGATVLMATHSNESLSYCDRLIRMKDGQIESDEKL
jgi:putative ABC transport system ATP-binding protein